MSTAEIILGLAVMAASLVWAVLWTIADLVDRRRRK